MNKNNLLYVGEINKILIALKRILKRKYIHKLYYKFFNNVI